MRTLYSRILVLLTFTVLACPSPARADRVSTLCGIVERTAHEKVRLRAIVALGRLRSPRAVSSLTLQLRDRSPTVRLLAARALGEAGTIEALKPLTTQLARETDASVKEYLSEAANRLQQRAARPPSGTRYLVVLGAMRNKTGKGEHELPLRLGEVMARALDVTPGWAIHPSRAPLPPVAPLQRVGVQALRVEATVMELTRTRVGDNIDYAGTLAITVRDAQGVSSRVVKFTSQIATPAAGHHPGMDAAFFTDLMEVAGRQAARRIISRAVRAFPPVRAAAKPEGP